ncbi:MAG: hypothetical protein GAK30_00449 [Paracidovorax wautersii]|uniref:Phospholipid-binding protein, PBP family n=1 Tax=Paracidovorax wautersii TaxID=1177982 RepID=A0A7V8FRQ2_9BURK|nr:MAG: hypothetical protein GAK30_00449 [Paracidovorax wautersii]
MKLISTSFANNAPIPAEFAFGTIADPGPVALSANRNPHLAWTDVPDGVLSFAVVCHDPDVPSRPDDVNQAGREVPEDLPRVDFFHWVLINLPAGTREIAAGSHSHGVTPRGKKGPQPELPVAAGVRHGLNDYTGWFAGDADMGGDYYGYDGPCPPWNDSIVHRYIFTVYALDVPRLEVAEHHPLTGAQVLAALEGRVVASAAVCGTYTLNRRLA